jgi:hypothetical protein
MGPATAWAIANAIHAESLGACVTCLELVHGGDECSTCLEDDGVVRHLDCCSAAVHWSLQ